MNSSWTLASVTLRRIVRGRALWVAAAIAILPIGFAYLLGQREDMNVERTLAEVFSFEQLVLAVLPAMLVAASIGEDIEDRTTTYLWSRPIPRWAILAGKLIAAVPVICGLALASWCLAVLVMTGRPPSAASCLALVLDGVALCLVAAAIATLAARYAMALTICYMLFFDVPLGVMPAAIQNLSVSYHGRAIAAFKDSLDPPSPVASGIAIAAIALIWTVVAAWRIRRLEA